MALDSLQRVIEKLQKTIEAHRGYLADRETRTRQLLIDPLLQKLRWNISNPNIVQLEYPVRKGRPDYALISKGKPLAVVEAKKLGTDLDEVITQAFNYANPAGIPYMIVTDGDKWEMYKVFEEATLEERLLVKLELSQQPARKNASQAWAMRKPNLTSKKPVFEPPNPAPDLSRRRPNKPQKKQSSDASSVNDDKYYSFASDKYPPYTKPIRLRMGNHIEKQVNSWRDVIHEVAAWLIDKGMLSANDCPVEIGRWTFINSEALNQDGTPFANPRELPNGLILQRNGPTTREQESGLRKLLDQLQVDTSAIQVFYQPTGKTSR